jgi:uracil phosphoribosyltransferase
MTATDQITTESITAAIEEIMNDTGCSKLKAITTMQGLCAKAGAEEVLEMLCEMKWAAINA